MADEEHVAILNQGVDVWNRWREENPDITPELSEVNLSGAELLGIDLSSAQLSQAHFFEANLQGADLKFANLDYAYFHKANLQDADLSYSLLTFAELQQSNLTRANLHYASLNWADLGEADLRRANLTNANLSETNLVKANLGGADLTGARVYGISAWDVNLNGAIQSNLIITPTRESIITVDNLVVDQFIYLLLYNEKIRHVIETVTSKVVLILGRFTPERKAVLDAIREELRRHDLLPVLFDFEKPATRDIHETVTTLARMARFVIADITDPKSIPQELVSIVEQMPSLPVQPILQDGFEPWGMYDHIQRYPWVLTIHRYRDLDDLLVSLKEKVVAPAEMKAKKLAGR